MEKTAAKIEKGKVTNVIVVDSKTPKELYDVELEAGSEVAIGWAYKDGEFIAPKREKPTDGSE